VISSWDENHEYHKDLLGILKFVEENQMRKICWWSKLDVIVEINNRNKDLPEDQQITFTEELADETLDHMEEDGDAGNGFAWDDLSMALDKALEK